MNSDADEFWEEIAPIYRTYRKLCPMTTDEAEAAFDDAPEIPMTAEEIAGIVEKVVAGTPPDWQPDPEEWSPDRKLDRVQDDMLAVYREEGEPDPDTDAKEDDLRKRMLSDEQTDQQDGVDGGAASSGDGGQDS